MKRAACIPVSIKYAIVYSFGGIYLLEFRVAILVNGGIECECTEFAGDLICKTLRVRPPVLIGVSE